ncbi:hypothetical protein [Algoriphagus sp. CAU 1675]|uniref:hypothetical protein n=1 Tax=Algoriphagus sp. CAU 1675 TaxID=3032597 RepID=UPI0023DA8AA1|nr:hypothetical protein [Algoriphagus sp. CAU 1675]MDF2157090.1 hypothetical protein [Algoriphagus sp. CAU 1675]
MSVKKITTGVSMILRMLVRQKIVILLILVIPAFFLTIVELTSSDRILPFQLASVGEDIFVNISENGISFIFFSVASSGFLVSFLALNLIQKNNLVNRRLIICGYHPVELLLSILTVLVLVITFIAVYVGLLTNAFYSIEHLEKFILGLVLIGFVYGSYGLAVGSLIKGELEGILMIVLLVNIDVGWLQNPLFYAEAQNQIIIKFLPAYFPSQTCIITAVTDFSSSSSTMYSLAYGSIFLFFSMLTFFYKMRTK